jgi:transitional endoplasmic reticulum ATPase
VDSKITLDEVGGLREVKSVLRDIAVSFQHAEVMAKWGAKRPQGVLLYGPPGTGKTMLTEALSNEIDATLWSLQSTDIYEKWLGNSEGKIKAIFDQARQFKGRLILFFDEFESMVGITESPNPGGADNARNAVAGIFKQEMNTLAQENPNVLVVAATNDYERIDPSLIRSGRFDYKVYVPMPDEEARGQIIASTISLSMNQEAAAGFQKFGDDIQVPELTKLTDGMSGADIAEIFRRISLQKAMKEARTGEQQPPVNQNDIVLEVRRFRTQG